MLQSKHTEGPWKSLAGYGHKYIVRARTAHRDACADAIASVYQTRGKHPISAEECEANGILIAAAPETAAERDRLKAERDELLAACEQSLRSFRAIYEAIENGATAEEIIENKGYWPLSQLRAAIAKCEKGGE